MSSEHFCKACGRNLYQCDAAPKPCSDGRRRALPYLALYRPTKATFLPGERVQWMALTHKPLGTVIGPQRIVRSGYVRVEWDDSEWGPYTSSTLATNLRHLPHQRGQQ